MPRCWSLRRSAERFAPLSMSLVQSGSIFPKSPSDIVSFNPGDCSRVPKRFNHAAEWGLWQENVGIRIHGFEATVLRHPNAFDGSG
jgi:hypothetical protein